MERSSAKGRLDTPKTTPPTGRSDDLYPVARAAEYLNLSPRTLRSLRQLGKIPIVQVGRRRIAFDKADLGAYRDEHKQRGPRRRFGRRS